MNPFSNKFQNFPLFSKRFGPGSIDLGNVGIYIPQVNSKIPKPISRRRIIIKSLKVSDFVFENCVQEYLNECASIYVFLSSSFFFSQMIVVVIMFVMLFINVAFIYISTRHLKEQPKGNLV